MTHSVIVGSSTCLVTMELGRLVTMEEVADATDFLLATTGVNAENLRVDGCALAR